MRYAALRTQDTHTLMIRPVIPALLLAVAPLSVATAAEVLVGDGLAIVDVPDAHLAARGCENAVLRKTYEGTEYMLTVSWWETGVDFDAGFAGKAEADLREELSIRAGSDDEEDMRRITSGRIGDNLAYAICDQKLLEAQDDECVGHEEEVGEYAVLAVARIRRADGVVLELEFCFPAGCPRCADAFHEDVLHVIRSAKEGFVHPDFHARTVTVPPSAHVEEGKALALDLPEGYYHREGRLDGDCYVTAILPDHRIIGEVCISNGAHSACTAEPGSYGGDIAGHQVVWYVFKNEDGVRAISQLAYGEDTGECITFGVECKDEASLPVFYKLLEGARLVDPEKTSVDPESDAWVGDDVHARGTLGRTPLMAAAKAGDAGRVKSLLDKGADIGAADVNGGTALDWAAHSGDVATVQLLLEHGAKLEARDVNGDTPLHTAVLEGHDEVVRLLLERGADVNSRNTKNATPMHYAVLMGDVDIARILLEYNPALDIEVSGPFAWEEVVVGMTPRTLGEYLLQWDGEGQFWFLCGMDDVDKAAVRAILDLLEKHEALKIKLQRPKSGR